MNHPAVTKAAKEIDRATEGIYTEASEIFCRTNRDTADEFLYAKISEIIERETKYTRLVEAAELACKEQIFMGWAIAANERRRGIHERLRSVLAKIKEG